MMLFGAVTIYQSRGVVYSDFPTQEELETLNYEEANVLIHSRSRQMSLVELLETNLETLSFWVNLLVLSLIGTIVSVSSYLIVVNRDGESI